MKLAKQIIDGTEVYFENGVKKYEHRKDNNGYEWWGEYDSRGNEIYSKDSNGKEWRKKYNPAEEVEVVVEEVNIEPFTFKNK